MWYFDEEFDTPMPEWLAEECRQFYGSGPIGINFAQSLAAFLEAKNLDIVERDDFDFEVTITPAEYAELEKEWLDRHPIEVRKQSREWFEEHYGRPRP